MANNYTLKINTVSPRSRSEAMTRSISSAGNVMEPDLSRYLTRAEFARYFELINMASENSPEKFMVHVVPEGGLYTEGVLSAKGVADEPGYAPSPGLDLEELQTYLNESGYATENWVKNQNYLTKGTLDDYLAKGDYITRQGVLDVIREEKLATCQYVDDAIGKIPDTITDKLSYGWDEDENVLHIGHYTLSGKYFEDNIAILYANEAGSSATSAKLSNTVRLWGNSFNGTQNLDGALTPGVDATYNLGTLGRRWANVYADNLTASRSVKIGNGTISWENGYFLLNAGLVSSKFLSCKGLADDIDNEAGMVKLWGQSYNGLDDVKGLLNYVSGIGLNEDGDIDHSGVYITGAGIKIQNSEQNFSIDTYNSGVIMDFSPAYASVGIGGSAPENYKLYVNGNTSINGDTDISGVASASRLVSNHQIWIETETSAPFKVNSTQRVANLNADMVDGKHASDLGGGDPDALYYYSGNASIQAAAITYTSYGYFSPVIEKLDLGASRGTTWRNLYCSGNGSFGGGVNAGSITVSDGIVMFGQDSGIQAGQKGLNIGIGTLDNPFGTIYCSALYVNGIKYA